VKPILIHAHIFYPQLWEEIKSCLQNISASPYELYVTVVNSDKSLEEDILNFNPNANIEKVENKGFDIGPFIHTLNKVDLDHYSYIIKLHTKRDMHMGSLVYGYNFSGDKWRRYALLPFGKKSFRKSIEAFEQNKKLGMISNFRLIKRKEVYDIKAAESAQSYLDKSGFPKNVFVCVIGTIFMARADLFKLIQKLDFNFEDFECSDKTEGSKAYILERLFAMAVEAQGYKVQDVHTPKIIQFVSGSYLGQIARKISRFVYHKYINRKGKLKITIFRIPVYSKKAR
jgi:lipopolysaccharide biosynthesis protein